jgi:hypothetical protein
VAICSMNENGEPEMKKIKQTRIEVKDDTSDAQLHACLEDIRAFSKEHNIDLFMVKERARKGRMAGGPATFKLETLLQLNESTETGFVHAATLAAFTKKKIEDYPEKLPVYLKNAYAAAVYGLQGG